MAGDSNNRAFFPASLGSRGISPAAFSHESPGFRRVIESICFEPPRHDSNSRPDVLCGPWQAEASYRARLAKPGPEVGVEFESRCVRGRTAFGCVWGDYHRLETDGPGPIEQAKKALAPWVRCHDFCRSSSDSAANSEVGQSRTNALA